MLGKIRSHQFFFIGLSFFTILLAQFSAILGLNDLTPVLAGLFIVIMSLGVSHGASDAIIIWNTFNQFKLRCYVFLIYFLVVILAFYLWLAIPAIGLTLLLLMSIFHFGSSDLKYLNRVNKKINFCWGFVMTFLPIVFYPSEVKIIFDFLINFDLNLDIFEVFRLLTVASILSLIYLIFINDEIHPNNKIFLIIELLVLVLLAKILTPLLWFAFYFCLLHGLRALINLRTISFKDLCLIVIFTLPVIFFSYFLLDVGFESSYIRIIFPILMALTVSHMLLPILNKFFLNLSLGHRKL